jgi:hypothetical protein
MKSAFDPISANVPNDDVAFLGSSEESLAVGTPGQRIEFVAVRVDAVFYFKLKIALSNRSLSQCEG